MRTAILTHSARDGDAVGNQIAAYAAALRSRGSVRVYADTAAGVHPEIDNLCEETAPGDNDAFDQVRAADLVIVVYSQAFGLLEWVPRLAGAGPRVVFDYHGVTPPNEWPAGRNDDLCEGLRRLELVRHAHAAWAHSRFTREELVRITGYPADRVFVLGCPILDIETTPGPKSDWRERLGLAGGAKLLLSVGRLAVNKRLAVLVRALARLRERGHDVHGVFAGPSDDLYALEAEACRALALDLGVADRLHIVGRVSGHELRDLYRSADVFVTASAHEGFCVPAFEAMAAGVPVVAARSAALPETAGTAALTFAPGDVDDLTTQVRRILYPQLSRQLTRRVAVVAPGWGGDVVGGAERSLRLIAVELRRLGWNVEVFTVGSFAVSRRDEDLTVHCFTTSAYDGTGLSDAQAATRTDWRRGRELAAALSRSPALTAELVRRASEFDAIIAGPYLAGTTLDVAHALPDQTVLVPCFHDEPFARSEALVSVYRRCAGALYHSAAEEQLARIELGVHVPNRATIGGLLGPFVITADDRVRGAGLTHGLGPYAVYCGRWVEDKNVGVLLAALRRHRRRPGAKLELVVVGSGGEALAGVEGVTHLGALSAGVRAAVVAGARVLAQPSVNESLSWVALDAWQLGVPVIGHADCPAVAAMVRESGGGSLARNAAALARALGSVADRPARWRRHGANGRRWVLANCTDRDGYARSVETVVEGVALPIAEVMRRRGLVESATHTRPSWHRRFDAIIDHILRLPARSRRGRTPGPTLAAQLARLEDLCRLPEGAYPAAPPATKFGRLKEWLKSRVFGPFRRLYVDRLARRQSAFNETMLAAVRQLAAAAALPTGGPTERPAGQRPSPATAGRSNS